MCVYTYTYNTHYFIAFNSIWVSTDDPEIKKYVLETMKGIQVHDRASYTATDEATSLLAVQEFQSLHPGKGVRERTNEN